MPAWCQHKFREKLRPWRKRCDDLDAALMQHCSSQYLSRAHGLLVPSPISWVCLMCFPRAAAERTQSHSTRNTDASFDQCLNVVAARMQARPKPRQISVVSVCTAVRKQDPSVQTPVGPSGPSPPDPASTSSASPAALTADLAHRNSPPRPSASCSLHLPSRLATEVLAAIPPRPARLLSAAGEYLHYRPDLSSAACMVHTMFACRSAPSCKVHSLFASSGRPADKRPLQHPLG